VTIRRPRPITDPRTNRGGCPTHGPLMVSASEEGHYSACCLTCGARGPEREDGWGAKLAFDEVLQPPAGEARDIR
jgi:hypothetical protein